MESLFDRLDREWQRLGADPAAAKQLPEVLELAGNASTLEGVRQWVEAAPASAADRVLAALAARAVEGDQLGARILLQLLVPGTRRLARKWWALGTLAEREAAAVAAVFDRIRCYPITRRPAKIAANILLDASARLSRQVHDTRGQVSLDAVGELATTNPTHPAVELASLLCEAVNQRVITRHEAELIATSRITGRRIADLAAERGMARRTLEKHRHAAEVALTELGAVA